MKKYPRLFVMVSLFVLSFCVLPQGAKSQPDPPIGEAQDPDAPIDGGVSLLVAAGVVYGIKKIREERKKKLTELP